MHTTRPDFEQHVTRGSLSTLILTHILTLCLSLGLEGFALRPEVNYVGDPEVLAALICNNPKCHGQSLLEPSKDKKGRDVYGRWSITRKEGKFKTVFGDGRPQKANIVFSFFQPSSCVCSDGILDLCTL